MSRGRIIARKALEYQVTSIHQFRIVGVVFVQPPIKHTAKSEYSLWAKEINMMMLQLSTYIVVTLYQSSILTRKKVF